MVTVSDEQADIDNSPSVIRNEQLATVRFGSKDGFDAVVTPSETLMFTVSAVASRNSNAPVPLSEAENA